MPVGERVRVGGQPQREMQLAGERVAMVRDPVRLQGHLVPADAVGDRAFQSDPTDLQLLGERQQIQWSVEVRRLRYEDMNVVGARRRATVVGREADVLVAPSRPKRAGTVEVGEGLARDPPAIGIRVGTLRQPHRHMQLARAAGAVVLDAVNLDGDGIVRDAPRDRAPYLHRSRCLDRPEATCKDRHRREARHHLQWRASDTAASSRTYRASPHSNDASKIAVPSLVLTATGKA